MQKRKEKTKVNKFTKAFYPKVEQVYVRQFRDFVEIPANEDFSEMKGHVVECVRNNRRFVWCDVYHEQPNQNNPDGNTIIVPVTKSHFVELLWQK